LPLVLLGVIHHCSGDADVGVVVEDRATHHRHHGTDGGGGG